MKITFCGGAEMVTGSNYLLESESTKILVDCGLNQGSSYCEKLNFEPFSYDPKSIEAVFVSHAHIDHTGRLPKLYKDGFRGKIFSTPPTKDFSALLLMDSQGILSREAEEKGMPQLYGMEDIDGAMTIWQGINYHEKVKIGDFEIELYDAGHILGSASIYIREIKNGEAGETIVFSGDLGNYPTPIIKDTEMIKSADYALIESAYGGRVHEDLKNRRELLQNIIKDTIKAGGTLMIPAFAMERTQDLLYELNDLVENKHIPQVPVFIDSPLAIKLTRVYKKYLSNPAYFDDEAIALLKTGDTIFDFPGLKSTLTTDESKQINDVPPPKIIIAGSGMSHGGRILHHERRYLSDPKSTLLFIGYQAIGSLGRKILDGAERVKIFGEEVPVRCRVEAIGGYSAHADQPKLIAWLESMKESLKKVFIVQGEEEQMKSLANAIKEKLSIDTIIPREKENFVI